VLARLNPQERLKELGAQLMKPGLGPQLTRVLTDYTNIWDRLEAASQKPVTETSEVADWIATFQGGGTAVEKWRSKRTMPWLVAALVSLKPDDAAAPDLITAAHAIKPDSPAYSTVTYYGILQQIRRGELDAARQWTDQALSQKQSDGALNLLRAERLNLARDWTEFLRFATRKPVVLADDAGGDEPVTDAKSMAFDLDATAPLNTMVPLKLWIEAAQSSLLPRTQQGNIAQAAWVRAVILRDEAAARTLAARVRQLKPELAGEMRLYLAEPDPAAANFDAVFLMLRAPGLEPTVRAGVGRRTGVLASDMFRDNWWELPESPVRTDLEHNHEALYDLYPNGTFGPSGFVPKDQRAAGEDEWRRLRQRAGNAVDYLCAETLDWARAHPGDPRVPQALHLAVEATHYGPKDEQSSRYSKQAFDLLHRNYPKSQWTVKTKYWY
jgi:hypothetical protein